MCICLPDVLATAGTACAVASLPVAVNILPVFCPEHQIVTVSFLQAVVEAVLMDMNF